jgi:hypothetical protein
VTRIPSSIIENWFEESPHRDNLKMGQAVKNHRDSLVKATSSRAADGVPNAAVISAEADGWRLSNLYEFED